MPPIGRYDPKKKALLVAVGYRELHEKHPNEDPQFMLPGTHKDPPRLKDLLLDKYGFAENDIIVLMDDGKHARPTKDTMLKEMKALVQDAQSGDHFVFSFSGHGSQIENKNGQEEDGFDEVFWPVDVQYDPSKKIEIERATNYIMDDDLKRILVDDLPPNAHLTVLLDCCHSGTGADLPFHKADDSLDSQWSPSSSLVSSPINLNSPEFPRQLGGDGARTNPERTTSIDTVLSVPSPIDLGPSELAHRFLGSKTKTNPERTVTLDAMLSVSSPVDLGPSGIPRRLLGNGIKTNPERTTSLDVLSQSRSSTMDSKSSMLKRNPKRTGSMRMPYMTRGGLISFMPDGTTVTQTEEVSVDPKIVPEKKIEDLAHATSWSACSDDQLGLDSNNGGILTDTFVQLLRDGHPRTNREMLTELNKRVFDQAFAIKPEFKKRKWPLPQPKPCLGSLRPLDEILDVPFTF